MFYRRSKWCRAVRAALCAVVVIFSLYVLGIADNLYWRGYSYVGANLDKTRLIGSVSGRACTKQTRFHFTKVEKTGSSTLATIFSRFVLRHQIQNVMIMTYGGHLDTTKRQGQVPGWDIGPRPYAKADVLVDHARFDEVFMKKHFNLGTALVTSVREPLTWFRSAVNFWKKYLHKKKPFEVLEDDKLMYLPRSTIHDEYSGMKSILHISQLQWLGFNYAERDNMAAIKLYIEYLVRTMDIVFLNDQFDASLILLKRRFCWDHADIIYTPMEVHNTRKIILSQASRQKLLSKLMNLGEELLYEAFNSSWWSQPEVKDPDFWQEVEYFKDINNRHFSYCKRILANTGETTHTFNSTKWSRAVVLDKEICKYLSLKKYDLMTELSKYALGYKYYLNHVYKLFDYYWWYPT